MKLKRAICAVRVRAGAFALAAAGLVAATPARGDGEVELAVWNDPDFRRRFAESYMAETDVEPRLSDAERETMQGVLASISSGASAEAAAALEKELAKNPSANAVVDFTLANLRFQAEDFERAAASYRNAVEKFPKFRRAWKNLGLIRARRGEHAEAIEALTRTVELGGGDAATYGLLGFAYSSTENHVSAESAYRMALLLDPASMDWKMGLARSFFRQERYAEAAALCETLLEKDPDRADLWLLQANAYVGLQRPLDAAKIYELVDRMGKSTFDSMATLGDIYVNDELFAPAAEAYASAVAKDPKAGATRGLRAAKALAARGAIDETKSILDRVEKLAADHLTAEDRKEALKIRARVAVAEGASGEEVRVLEEIVALDPLDGEALLLLGRAAEREGDAEKAIFLYERAANIERFEADAKVRHAQVLVSRGRYEEALPLLRRAQTLDPKDGVQKYLEQVERVARGK